MAIGTVQAGYGNAGYSNLAATNRQTAKAESSMFFTERLWRCVEEAAGPSGNPAVFCGKLDAGKASAKAESPNTGKSAADVGEETDVDVVADETAIMDYQEFFQNKINEIYEKVQRGETEPSFQIGARSFTQKEWDEFLEKFDAVEEAIRELMREEHEKRASEQLKKQQEAAEDQSSLLLTESTSCVYPSADAKKEDDRYITWYTKERIICRKMGETEDEWSISFTDESQYDKVMEFMGQFPSDWNMRFAAHENFWTDFLKNEIDLEGFMEFMKGTDHGIPDDRLSTKEEFQKMWEMVISE